MTSLLRDALAEAEKLPAEDQDAIASRLFAEVDDERKMTSEPTRLRRPGKRKR